jgi:hypothetical protein
LRTALYRAAVLRRGSIVCAVAAVVAACVAYAADISTGASGPRPLVTAINVTGAEGTGRSAAIAFDRIRASGARVVRMPVAWRSIAPKTPPANFNPSDPADRSYNWKALDAWVTLAARRHLQPMLIFWDAPYWARVDPTNVKYAIGAPRLADFAAFATAAAKRYSGSFQGLPRVRYWIAWNEPNAIFYWAPQFAGEKAVAPAAYRALVNKLADVVHGVKADNLVVAGALTPFTRDVPQTMGPLRFMREVLCLSDDRVPKPTCRKQVHFDVWSHHPYTSGGPSHHAVSRDDVSLGDLPEMKRLLDAGRRFHHILSSRPVEFWVTEFSWDSNPPDKYGVPIRLHARWTAEALYRMWKAGVTLVTWLELRDNPLTTDIQSGLYYRGSSVARDRPKRSLSAFRFPFVAFASSSGISYWGRTPLSHAGRVRIEFSRKGDRWRKVRFARANAAGIFLGRVNSSARRGFVRAVVGGSKSVPFSLTVPADRAFTPFGTGPPG